MVTHTTSVCVKRGRKLFYVGNALHGASGGLMRVPARFWFGGSA